MSDKSVSQVGKDNSVLVATVSSPEEHGPSSTRKPPTSSGGPLQQHRSNHSMPSSTEQVYTIHS